MAMYYVMAKRYMFASIEATSEKEAIKLASEMPFHEFDTGSDYYPDFDDISVVDVEEMGEA